MSRNALARVLTISAIFVVLLALPLGALARQTHSSKTGCTTGTHRTHRMRARASATAAVITFGIQGGNIMPWSVTMHTDGAVTTTGWMKVRNPRLADPTNTLNGLLKLGDATGFFSMPAFANCSGTLPDITSRYVTINSNAGSHTVKIHGGCNTNFSQLWASLENTADLQH